MSFPALLRGFFGRLTPRRSVLLLALGWLLAAGSALAQTPAPAPSAPPTPAAEAVPDKARLAPKRTLAAVRLTGPAPRLDGLLDEAAWATAPIASQFYEQEPTPGRRERHPTEVRVLYDDAAIYVGAVMHDAAPDSILNELTARDDIGNADWFGVFLDTYHDRLNGYEFLVTPGGVQLDARLSPAGGEDTNWTAVWDAHCAVRGRDWVAEMRIPYAALRFSKAPEQLWGLNFGRQRRSTRQTFFWNEVKPAVDGFANQWGDLTGLRDIVPPLRLSLVPYVSAYANHYPYNEQGKRNHSSSLNGGADVKWGINESFTLDATLVPDFGQVQSDNQVLNLSPFEVRFNENRQFFTEGTELFNKGDLFYSRRVGAQPIGFYGVEGQLRRGAVGPDGQRRPGEFVVQNPGITPLLNATKVSGRTGRGLGVGVFNALSNDVLATVQDSASGGQRQILTQPFANYSIVVLDQSLPNNSFVSLVNTNVTRRGETYDANVTGGLFRFASKANAYALEGRAIYAHRRGKAFGSADEIDNQNGYKYYLNVAKISGNFTWNLDHGIESHTYDPNDLGLLFANNSITQSANVAYNLYQPFWKVNRFRSYAGVSYSLLQQPAVYQDAGFYAGANTTFTKRFLTTGLNFDCSPNARDYFDPRREPIGQYYVFKPANAGLNGFISTDYRRPLAWDVSYRARWFADDRRQPDLARTGRHNYSFGLAPRYRLNNHFNLRYEANIELVFNQIGYAGGLNAGQPLDAPLLAAFGPDVLLGRRRRTTVSNTLTLNYTFTNRISFTVRTRHYASTVQYRDFSRLHADDGRETAVVGYARNRDNSFNAFNVDAVFAWWFAPGSQVSVVWKNAAATFLEAERALPQYFDNLSATVNTPHNNNVSVKVVYFLDYLMLRNAGFQPARQAVLKP